MRRGGKMSKLIREKMKACFDIYDSISGRSQTFTPRWIPRVANDRHDRQDKATETPLPHGT